MGYGMSAGAVARGEKAKGFGTPRAPKVRYVARASMEERILEALRALWSFSKGPGAKSVVEELARKYQEECADRDRPAAMKAVMDRLAGAQAVVRNMKKLRCGYGMHLMIERLEKQLDYAVGACVGEK